jgi:hypothetical protein
MCLGADGEISELHFYGLVVTEQGCEWDRSTAFATIEQDVVERTTGLRFPSRVRTSYALDWRDTAIFVQTFEDCVFTNVRVSDEIEAPR